MKRDFSRAAAESTAYAILTQAKIDNIKIFELLDTLKGFDEIQLSKVVTEVLNYNRQKMSSLGYKIDQSDSKLESRNILV